MALVNPNIAMSFRQPDIQAPNALAQFAQIQQIQGGQQAQELARYQLGAAQRAEATQNALADAYGQSVDPTTGAINYNKLTGLLAKGGGASQIPGIEKTRRELEAAELTKRKLEQDIATGAYTQKNIQSQIDERAFTTRKKKLDFSWNAVGSAPNPQAAIAELTKGVEDGVFDMRAATAEIQQVQNMTPEQYQQYRAEKILSILDAKDKLPMMLPKTRDRDIGGQIQTIQNNPMLPGYGQPVAGGAIAKTPTFGELTGQRQLVVSQGQLALAQQKFAWEKANPGFELKEAEDGSIVGVNKRTLQAFPVTIGGDGAPVAATPGAGMPGPRVAPVGAVTPAIPGMTSVLDKAAPAVATPAAPLASGPRQLIGKGTAMTEAQSKSAMFGAAMNQANNVISKVEKDGTTTAPVAVSVLQGLAKLSPQFLGTCENAASAIESIFRQDPTSLLGPDVNQQKLGQAQVAFATAYLRATSGAAFGPSEVSNTIKEYFPLVGEDKAVVKQKAQARQRAIEGMKISTTKQGQSYINKSGANENDPLDLFGGK